jgi:hypothetical protein
MGCFRQARRAAAPTLVAFAVAAGLMLTTACDNRVPGQSSPKAKADSSLGARLVAGNFLTDEWREELGRIIPVLVEGTQFENRWSVNTPQRHGGLEVYVLRGDLGARATELPAAAADALDNCAASRERGVVLCDASFLRSFLDESGVSAGFKGRPDSAEFRRAAQESLLFWVLGHELGHVVFGDAAAHFHPRALSSYVATASLQQQRELRADSFFVTRVTRDEDRAAAVAGFVMNVMNVEIRDKIGDVPAGVGLLFDYTNHKVVTYARSGTHPEFVVRGARMFELMGASHSPKLAGLAAMVRPLVRQMREAK